MECQLVSEIETLVVTGGIIRVLKKDESREAMCFTARVMGGILVPMGSGVLSSGSPEEKDAPTLEIVFNAKEKTLRYFVGTTKYGTVENEYHLDLVVSELYTQFKSHTGFIGGLMQKRTFPVRADWGWCPC